MLPFGRSIALLVFLVALTGCMSNRREGVIPQFRNAPLEPIAIRVDDQRPPLAQKIEAGRGTWLYYRANPDQQAMEVAQSVGNALNVFRATRGYRIVKLDSPVEQWPVLIHIEYRKGYSRWPVEVGPEARAVPVEGAAELHYRIYRNGRKLDSGTLKNEPPPLNVPLSALRRDNIEKMVRQSLGHQYNLVTRNVMDELMHDLADVWPELTGPEKKRREVYEKP